MIVAGFVLSSALVLVLVGCLYVCESKRADSQYALESIDALYIGLCAQTDELVRMQEKTDSIACSGEEKVIYQFGQ